jgi:hypothetical protein
MAKLVRCRNLALGETHGTDGMCCCCPKVGLPGLWNGLCALCLWFIQHAKENGFQNPHSVKL